MDWWMTQKSENWFWLAWGMFSETCGNIMRLVGNANLAESWTYCCFLGSKSVCQRQVHWWWWRDESFAQKWASGPDVEGMPWPLISCDTEDNENRKHSRSHRALAGADTQGRYEQTCLVNDGVDPVVVQGDFSLWLDTSRTTNGRIGCHHESLKKKGTNKHSS